MDRRDFMKTVPAAAYAVAAAGTSLEAATRPAEATVPTSAGAHAAQGSTIRLEPFDYDGVRLLSSRWQRQYTLGRDFYYGVPDADILHGFRAAAGQPAPGRPLGGWAGVNSNTVFGQWLSGMARMARATDDRAMRDKALELFTQWERTLAPDGDPRMGHYPLDKLTGGLVDLHRYLDHRPALAALDRVTDHAIRTLERPKLQLSDPTHNQHYYGLPQEWYTLGEHYDRAFQATGDTKYRRFADEWQYRAWWAKFANSSSPADAHGVHAYSHTNTFSSAAMAYEVSGDPALLAIVRNGYEYLQRHQCYATGLYGPNERFMALDGSLGRALDTRSDTVETSCGAWAGFKLARYLMRFTGEARYGDWIERLFYNGIGAALPITAPGRNFYYGDYRVGGGMKVYNWDLYTCCSGTYIQNLADFHNIVYYRDARGLYVNLYVPSEVTWQSPAGEVVLAQETNYPDADTTTIVVKSGGPDMFPIRWRVPSWTRGASARVNGEAIRVDATPGTWGTITRTWRAGDRLELTIPLTFRMEALDAQHPDRVAVMRGPVVLVLEGAYHDPNFRLPMQDDELERWLVPEPGGPARGVWSTAIPPTDYPTCFRVEPPDKSPVRLRFRPFYEVGENYPYFMYFDRRRHPWRLW